MVDLRLDRLTLPGPVSGPVGGTAAHAAPVAAPAATVATAVPAGVRTAAVDVAAVEEPTEDLTETAEAVRTVTAAAVEGEGLFEDTGLRPGAESAERRPSHPSSRPRSRRSMPSWDDIMLGSAPRGD